MLAVRRGVRCLSSRAVLTVRPDWFSQNEETMRDNSFMVRQPAEEGVLPRVQREFQGYVEALRGFGVRVVEHGNPREEGTPDAIFPNNWFSTHPRLLVLYPMMAPSRRAERKQRIISQLQKECVAVAVGCGRCAAHLVCTCRYNPRQVVCSR